MSLIRYFLISPSPISGHKIRKERVLKRKSSKNWRKTKSLASSASIKKDQKPETDDICIISENLVQTNKFTGKTRQWMPRRDSVLKYLLLNPEIGKIS